MKRQTIKYKGELICRSTYQGSKRWYVQAYHHTGLPYGENNCPQFNTIAYAKITIRDGAK